jgi:hypothetical protein
MMTMGYRHDEHQLQRTTANKVLEYGCTAGISIAVPESGTAVVTYTAARLCYKYISSYSTLAHLMCL